MGIMVIALTIFLRSANSTVAPSGWFMHAWSHIIVSCIDKGASLPGHSRLIGKNNFVVHTIVGQLHSHLETLMKDV